VDKPRGINPIVRDLAKGLVALAVCLIVISTLAGLSGCGGGDPDEEPAPDVPTPNAICPALPPSPCL
jgi:hypothetical protein